MEIGTIIALVAEQDERLRTELEISLTSSTKSITTSSKPRSTALICFAFLESKMVTYNKHHQACARIGG